MEVMDDLVGEFIEYGIFDEIGDLIGISEDAPLEAKESYIKYTNMLETAKRKNIVY